MSQHVVVPRDEVSRLVTPAYQKLGFQPGEVLDHCLTMGNDGWQNGVSTHGHNVILINHGAFGVESGLIDPLATEHKLLWDRPSIKHWDGSKIAGPALARRALDAAIEMATETGVGNLQVTNTGHIGCPGVIAKKIAEAGFVGRVLTRGGRVECMAPGGQKSPRTSTDTISWGLPTCDILGFPMVLDFTLAEIAMGKVRKAQITGAPLPPGVCYDENGYSTDDPFRVFPNGATSHMGREKGYGLAAFIETFGSFFGFTTPSVVSHLRTGDNPTKDVRNVSVEIEVLEVPKYGSQNKSVAEFVEYVFGGSETLRIPGKRRHEFSQLCEEHGGLLLGDDIVNWLTDGPFADVIQFDADKYETVEL